MSEIKVNSIKGVGASTAAITVNNSDGTCTANITNNLSNRNLIINGAMQVAQRGTSSTSSGYQTVDRFQMQVSGADEAPTQAQVDVASGTTPYTLGFRKALRITNGNQTSGAGTSDRVRIEYKIEAQDVANSGWNYTSSSSFITLSFWCKSSVAQNFYGRLYSYDGTAQAFIFETGSLSADTWTKVTVPISGNSNLTFDNNNSEGLYIAFGQFVGTDYTTASPTLNAWAAYDGNARYKDFTSTWYTTNDATFELTGVQLEVGSVATDFEHRSFAQELALCQRYFLMVADGSVDNNDTVAAMFIYTASNARAMIHFPVSMRTIPDIYSVGGTDYFRVFMAGGTNLYPDAIGGGNERLLQAELSFSDGLSGMTPGQIALLRLNNASARIGYSAEL